MSDQRSDDDEPQVVESTSRAPTSNYSGSPVISNASSIMTSSTSTSSMTATLNTRKRTAPRPDLDVNHDLPATPGAEDANLLERILKCPICVQVFNEPYVTVCGHTFCQKCLRRSLNMRHRCPSCDGELKVNETNAFPNHALNNITQLFRSQASNVKKLRTTIPTRADLLVDADTLTSLARQLLNQTDAQTETSTQTINTDNPMANVSSSRFDQLATMQRLLRALHVRYEQLQHEQKVVSRTLLCDFIDEMIARRSQMKVELDAELNLLQSDKKTLMGATLFGRHQQCGVVPTSDVADVTAISSGVLRSSSEPLVASEASTSTELLPTSLTNVAGLSIASTGQAQNLLRCRQQMMKHYDDLQTEYLLLSRQRLQAFTADAASQTTSSSTAGHLVAPPLASTESAPSDSKLDDFATTLGKITRYSGFRRLASINYNADFAGGLSIVSSIEFDKDCEYFVVAGVTRQIKMYDFSAVISESVDVHYPIATMQCDSKISCCSWNTYSKSLLANSDYDGCVQLWDTWNAKRIRKYQEHERRCWTVNFSETDPLTFASGSDDSTVKLWSVNCANSIANIHTGVNVCCCQFSPTSKYNIVVGTADHCARHYDVRNVSQPLTVLRGHHKAVSYVKYLSSTEVVTASTDSQLRLWDINTGECTRVFTGHVNEKNFVGLAVGSDFITCGSETNALHVYHKSISHGLLDYNFDDHKSPTSGPVFDQRRTSRQNEQSDLQEFVSATCWKKNSNVIVAANSHGDTQILELV